MTGPTFVHYIPILTTLLALPFAFEILRRYRRHPERLHLLWWGLGVLIYGVGTFTEAATTLAVRSGDVQMLLTTPSAAMLGQVQQGNIKLLAVASPQPSPVVPLPADQALQARQSPRRQSTCRRRR